MEFRDANELKQIALDQFIGANKPHWHLRDCKILWLFAEGGNLQKGYAVSRVPGLWKHVTGFDVVIKVLPETWEDYRINGKGPAFVDHLLSHVELGEDDRYVLAQPPVQEFPSVVHRHGAWRQPVSDLTGLGG